MYTTIWSLLCPCRLCGTRIQLDNYRVRRLRLAPLLAVEALQLAARRPRANVSRPTERRSPAKQVGPSGSFQDRMTADTSEDRRPQVSSGMRDGFSDRINAEMTDRRQDNEHPITQEGATPSSSTVREKKQTPPSGTVAWHVLLL